MSMPAESFAAQQTLDELFAGIAEAPRIAITGISSDSRKLAAGNLFLACQGITSHGLDFAAQAVEAGVAAIAWDAATGSAVETGVPMIAVPDLAARIGEIANRWYGAPSEAVRVTGVTGTNGKTTVAWLVAETLGLLGHKAGYVGTLGHGLGDVEGSGAITTPACIELHDILADFRAAGAEHAAIEVSSHGLEQRRLDGIRFDSAIFTNLSRDHIDYHGSMEAYFESKAGLFLDFEVRNRIVCLDTEFGVELAERCGSSVVTVSTELDRVPNGRPHIFVRGVVATETGSHIVIRSSWGDASIDLPMPGEFNVANAVAVLAVLLCNDVPLDAACETLGRITAPPGRMQRVDAGGADALPRVYVDYSHTPASLEAALKALRAHCHGRLWCVFGCGGDRDRGKRPMMGKVAARLADHVVITSDNPRSESPQDIVTEILAGIGDGAVAIVDRAEAIARALDEAGADDVVLIAGKGHEDYQVIGDRTLPFSDYETARNILLARGARGT